MEAVLHAKTRSELDKASELLRSIGYKGGSHRTLPGDTVLTIGARTASRYYLNYDWHESLIETPSEEKKAREIYTTSPEHRLIGKRAEGFAWANKKLNSGYVEGIHLKADEPSAIHILDKTGVSHYCTEFKIYLAEESIESELRFAAALRYRWWQKKEPFLKEQQVYFLGYGQDKPEVGIVQECRFYDNLYFCGYWRVEAHLTEKKRTVSAGSWMFSKLSQQESKRGECFQVNQWYCDYPEETNYSTAVSSANNPCYNNEKEARDFLDAVTFPGDIVRVLTINGLKTEWTNGVVYRKKEGERNYEIARKQSAEVIEKAKTSKNLVRPLQTQSRKLSGAKLDYFI